LKLLNTPAGLLAQEGDLESAKFLVEFYGANPAFIVLGLLAANNREEANNWLKQYELNEERIASPTIAQINETIYNRAFETEIKPDTMTQHNAFHEAKAVTGEFDLHEFKKIHLLHEDAYLNALANGGHIYLLQAIFTHSLFTTMPSLHSLFSREDFAPEIGLPVFRLQTEKLALHAFSFIKNDNFLKAILKKIKKGELTLEPLTYNVEAVMNQARKIRTIMQDEKIGYSEAFSVCDQRSINLPPLLKTSRPFFIKTGNGAIKSDSNEIKSGNTTINSEQQSMLGGNP